MKQNENKWATHRLVKSMLKLVKILTLKESRLWKNDNFVIGKIINNYERYMILWLGNERHTHGL